MRLASPKVKALHRHLWQLWIHVRGNKDNVDHVPRNAQLDPSPADDSRVWGRSVEKSCIESRDIGIPPS